MNICPHCKKMISSLRIEGVQGRAATTAWKCITLACPSCSTVLSAQIDPVAIQTQLIAEIRKRGK